MLAVLGRFAGVMLWVPISVVSPFWLFLSLPQVLGALFASSIAYLFASPARVALTRIVTLSLVAAAVCAVANISLYTEMVPRVVTMSTLTPPGGQATLSAEAVLIGVVAGSVATGDGRNQRSGWIPFIVAVFLTALAISSLVFITIPVLVTSPPVYP